MIELNKNKLSGQMNAAPIKTSKKEIHQKSNNKGAYKKVVQKE